MTSELRCPICKSFDDNWGRHITPSIEQTEQGWSHVRCQRCGEYRISESLQPLTEDHARAASWVIRRATDLGQTLEVSAQGIDEMIRRASSIEGLRATEEHILKLIADVCRRPGESAAPTFWSEFAARAMMKTRACDRVLADLQKEGILRLGADGTRCMYTFTLLRPGWQRVESAADYEHSTRNEGANVLAEPMLDTNPQESDEQTSRAIDELARVYHDREESVLLAARSGFPTRAMPDFRNPLIFWSKIAEQAENGMVRGGVASILARAAEQYPENAIFAEYQQIDQGSTITAPLGHPIDLDSVSYRVLSEGCRRLMDTGDHTGFVDGGEDLLVHAEPPLPPDDCREAIDLLVECGYVRATPVFGAGKKWIHFTVSPAGFSEYALRSIADFAHRKSRVIEHTVAIAERDGSLFASSLAQTLGESRVLVDFVLQDLCEQGLVKCDGVSYADLVVYSPAASLRRQYRTQGEE